MQCQYRITPIIFTSSLCFTGNPLDVLRIRWQVSSAQLSGTYHNSIRSFAHSIVHEEGFVRGLAAPGIRANIASIFVSLGVRMGFYPYVRDSINHFSSLYLSEEGKENRKSASSMAVSGFVCGAAGFFLATPLFGMKTQLQAEAGVMGSDGVMKTGTSKLLFVEKRELSYMC